MAPCLKRACPWSYLITKFVNIAITTSCLHHEVICGIPCSAYNSVGQEEAPQAITAWAQLGMQSEREWRTGSSRECRKSSSDPLDKYHTDAWTSIPEKYLDQHDLVTLELQESSEVTKATPTCRRDGQCPVPLQEGDQLGQGHRHASQYVFWVLPIRV